MPVDISSSSSSSEDDELGTDAPADPAPTGRGGTRFQCPADFVSFSLKPCSSSLSRSSTELWLIKAPASFSPQSFSGVQLPLHGLKKVGVRSEDGTEQRYNVLGSPGCCPELRLLDPPTSLAPPFSGVISICESHTDDHSGQALHVVPAVPPPAIPPGLKLRFQHFQAMAEGSPPRKRKKERKIKAEPQRASEREAATFAEMIIKTEVKREPLDTGFGDQPEATKKKKKKKKSKSDE